jgi:hypothetical protein
MRSGGNLATCLRAKAAIALVILLGCFAWSGCNRGIPGLVKVTGKLTYDGGPWSKKGQVLFSPVKAAGDRPLLPAMAHLNEDGTFTVRSSTSNGMMPGEYNAVIRCWLVAPDDRHAGKSAVPQRYGSPLTSELKVTVPEGSKPIFVNWDIKSK